MNYSVTSARKPGTIEWLLLLISGLSLLVEAGYTLWSTYFLVQMSVALSTPVPLEGALTGAACGVLMLVAAQRCLLRPDIVLTKGMIPAVLVIPYGIWLAHGYSGGFVDSFARARAGDLGSLGFLGGAGLVVIGLLVVAAYLLNEQRRRYRLRGFRS